MAQIRGRKRTSLRSSEKIGIEMNGSLYQMGNCIKQGREKNFKKFFSLP